MPADALHSTAALLAGFMASLVEFVEALTVVLAVGTVRGWRDALLGAAGALLVLVLLGVVLGPALMQIPLRAVRLGVGLLLLLFGLRWLRKAVLRAGGVIPLHDEASIFTAQRASLRTLRSASGRHDMLAMLATFKITLLEGLEVVFIVTAIAAGGTHLWLPASLGALAALALVAALGMLLHRPLARIPENTLKFGVGVLISSFGTFWVGEGLGLRWPAADASLGALIAGYALVALTAVTVLRHRQ
jgi:uncharacterized membrane protein